MGPMGKKEPDGGLQTTVLSRPQLPVAVGVVKLTTAPHWFASFDLVMLAGQVIEVQLIENAQRQDVHPYEEAAAYRALLDLATPQYDVATIAARIGKAFRMSINV